MFFLYIPPIIYDFFYIWVNAFLHIVTIFCKKRPHRKGVENDGAYVTITHYGPRLYNHLYVQPFGSRFFWFYCYLIYQSAVWLKNIIVRRECWGTDIITIHLERNRGSNTSMSTSLVERCYRTALYPLNWNIQRISLDTYTAKVVNSSALRE